MRSRTVFGLFLAAYICNSQQPRPQVSRTPQTEYSFAVRSGKPTITIRIEIAATGKIGNALVFQEGTLDPIQRLASCQPNLAMELYEGDESTVLVEHADFNFDGYEDLKILQFHHPHLGKSIFCVYVWDDKTSKFRYEPQIPMPDPVPHAESKTITTHNVYMGGTWNDSVYVWSGNRVIPIAEWGLANEAGLPGTNADCPWTAWCSKRVNGRMRSVVRKSTGCNGADPETVNCTPPPRSIYVPKVGRK